MWPTPPVLFVTVGGSHQPVVTAVRHARPRFVVFLCTDRDPATGEPGSRGQIENQGSCIKADPRDEKPTLPNIPAQCSLEQDSFALRIVPADDLDGAYGEIRAAMREMRDRDPGARLLADYTGGTKTMTAALVAVALDEEVELQFVTGTRADLVKVRDGTQEAAPAQVEAVRLDRAMAPLLAAWSRFAYDEAAAGLEVIPVPANPRLRCRRHRALCLARALAVWDRFDHGTAHQLLDTYAASLRPAFSRQLDALKLLARGDDTDRQRCQGLRIWDLWLNAQRRAAAGRYDDAVARAYRMIEWAAQSVLESRKGWRTADLPAAVAVEVGIAPSRGGAYQGGLFQAWTLVGRHAGGPAARFFEAQSGALLHQLDRRNASILAHGFAPVSAIDWQGFEDWLKTCFEPMLRDELAALRVRAPFPQLPDRYPPGN